jgi:hypothetical protein
VSPDRREVCKQKKQAEKLSKIGVASSFLLQPKSLLQDTPLPLLDDAIAVRDTVTRLISDEHAGKVQPKVAAELAPLLSLRLRALDAVREFERLERCHIQATWWEGRRITERSPFAHDESN